MKDSLSGLEFEQLRPLSRCCKAFLINPLANYLPASLVRALLRFGKSELAAANWADPGGWRSMVISYNGVCRQIADKVLVGGGTMAMALRNRRKLGARLLANLIESCGHEPVHVLCLGAGPGMIICDAMSQAKRQCCATLVDLNADAFDFGRQNAAKAGLDGRVRYVQGDVRDVRTMLADPPGVVKMLGICEYLSDEQIVSIAAAVGEVMPAGAPIVYNSLSRRHGTDRFFRRVFGLNMTHRSVDQLNALYQQAGFGDFMSIPEPLGVYHVVVARKNATKTC